MDTDEIVLKINMMEIKDKDEYEEKRELKRRSDLMDKKVEGIKRRREEEEKRYNEVKELKEKKRIESEEAAKVKHKDDLRRLKEEEKKKKIAITNEENMKERGISKLPEKYHHLVGEYKNVLDIPGNGSCQPSAKAAILLQDPNRGPQLAIEENSYIVEHWEKMFRHFYDFPQTLKLGGGKNLVCQTEQDFLEFLVLNPEASYMWADHHQLQVTSNLYNTNIQVLTINDKGEGSILKEPIRPNPAMAAYSIVPSTTPNGEKVDMPEVWLRYMNGNHYDALLKDNHPLITQGSLKERGLTEESHEMRLNKCEDCNFTFKSKDNLEEHQQKTGHTDGFWEIFPHNEKSKVNPISYCQITKGETVSSMVKEVLEFELTSESKGDETNSNLIKERKEHSNTKKALKALEEQFTKCKVELRRSEEETERFKIENKDLKAVIELTNIIDKEVVTVIDKSDVTECEVCEYPFRNKTDLIIHKEKHKVEATEINDSHNCGICSIEVNSNNELRKHIKAIHTVNFDCDLCDFQGSSKIILTKHANLKHRTPDKHESGTFKCTLCSEQYSSNWNLNNHTRDKHGKTQICKWFNDGKCRYPTKECWNIHEKEDTEHNGRDLNEVECHTCKESFKTKNEMMKHRLNHHSTRVKPCRDGRNCTRQTCWYRHGKDKPFSSREKDITDEWVINELDNENEDFQKAPKPAKPPAEATNTNSSPNPTHVPEMA